MNDVLAGIRVVEVASWTFVPSSGAILAEWGADVIKIEDPERGDPQRGLISSGIIPKGGANFMYEIPNRGKRSVGLNIASEAAANCSTGWSRRQTCSSPTTCPMCASGSASKSRKSARAIRASSMSAARATDRRAPRPTGAGSTARPTGRAPGSPRR